MPVIISEKDSFNPNTVEISPAPDSRKVIRKAVKIIYIGLNFASHDTIIAVKPLPPAVVVVIVWFVPPTRSKPAIPQTAPDRIIVLIITFFTFSPMYLAVFSLSPTTVSS